MNEKREYKRYPVKAELQSGENQEMARVCLESINISAGGILFNSNFDVPVGTRMTLRFTLPVVSRQVTALCETVHNLEVVPRKQYFIGARFSGLEGITASQLTYLLARHFGKEAADGSDGQ